MEDPNVVACPFDPNEEKIPLRGFGWTLFESFRRHSTSVALTDVLSGQTITYQELQRKSETVARHLLRIGCSTGDVIGMFSPNSIEWIIMSAAALRIGVEIVGIDCLLRVGELKHQLSTCKVTVLYTSRETAPIAIATVEEISCKIIVKGGGFKNCVDLESLFEINDQLSELPTFEQLNVKPDDPALILFSSGTTGAPKAIVLTHYNLHAMILAMSHPMVMGLYPKQLVFSPLSHPSGFDWIMIGLTLGNNTLLLPRFDSRVFLQCLQDHKLEMVFVVPPIASLLAKSREVDYYQLKDLKEIHCGAASLSSNVEDLLMERFPGLTFRQSYGLTETFGPFCTVPNIDKKIGRKPGSVGVPLINVRMKVVDISTGTSLGPNQSGEIFVSAATNSPGYKDNPEATAALIDKDGWIHTGDIGHYDGDGYFYIVDRLKELIKYNAYQVAPAELEGVLMSHPQVRDAGVFGLPDTQAGELPSAWVVLQPGSKVTEFELQQFVSERVAPYKKLRGGIKFVSAIPKSSNGKILRRRMREENLPRGKL